MMMMMKKDDVLVDGVIVLPTKWEDFRDIYVGKTFKLETIR